MAGRTPTPVGYAPRYDLSSILPTIDVTVGVDLLVRPTQRTVMIDALDQRIIDALDGVTAFVPVTWTGGKLSTLCYENHGTPDTKTLVLAYNGLSSSNELRPGMTLRVPTKAALDAALASAYAKVVPNGGIGSKVRI